MLRNKYVHSKVLIALLILMLLIGQTCVGSFGAKSSVYDNLQIKISKTVKSETTSDPNKYYLGQLVKATYTITSNEIEISVPKEIVFVIDLTSSMSTKAGTETRIEALKKVLAPFLPLWKGSDFKLCIVGFNSDVFIDTGLVDATDNNVQKLVNDVNSWSTATLKRGTNLGEAIKRAYYILKDSGTPNARKYIISLTDGEPDKYTIDRSKNFHYGKEKIGTNGITSAPSGDSVDFNKGKTYAEGVMENISKDNSIKNFLIGFGIGSSQASNLNDIAKAGGLNSVGDETGDGTPDYFYRPTTSSELQNVFDTIAKSITDEILLTTANITETLNEDISLPNDLNPYEGIPLTSVKEIGSQITIPLNLSLKRVAPGSNKYAIEKKEFSIYYRVASTGTINLPAPTGEFAFTDPVEGIPITKKSTGDSPEITVRQTVNSVYIPPKIIFTGEKANANIKPIINPKSGLEDEDNKLDETKWSISGDSGILSDYKWGDIFAQFKTTGNVGITEITATSKGFAFGGTSHVKGTGKVMVVKPTIEPVEVEVGKTVGVEKTADARFKLNLNTPTGYTSFLDDLNMHIMRHPFNDGYKYKISPLHRKTDFSLGITSPSSSIIQHTSFIENQGSWSLTPVTKDGEQYFMISNASSSKYLYAKRDGTVSQWGPIDPRTNDNELWKVDEMEDGFYKITSKLHGKCLEIPKTKSADKSEDPGTAVSTGTYNGYRNQKWDITPLGNKLQPSILDGIKFDKNVDGTPAVKIDDIKYKNSMKFAFGNDDSTKLVITGIIPTVLIDRDNPAKTKRASGPIKVIATVKYESEFQSESKADVEFTVDIFTRAEIN